MKTTSESNISEGIIVGSAEKTNDALTVKAVCDHNELRAFADSWNNLCKQSPGCLPQSSYAMTGAWLRHRVRPEEQWVVLIAELHNKPVGFLPLVLKPKKCLGLTLHTVSPPNDTQITSIDMVATPGMEPAILSAFLDTLREKFPMTSHLEMYRIVEGSSTHCALQRPPSGFRYHRRPTGMAACYSIEGSFERYLDTLKPNFSRNLRRLDRKIESASDIEVITYAGKDISDELFERFLELEASGWKGKERGAILSYPSSANYYREAFRNLRELGWVELNTMQFNGKFISAQLAVRLNRTVFLFKICYNEEFSSLAPGNMLMARTIQRAYENRDTDLINCLTDTGWHNNWVVTRKSYTTVVMTPWRILPFAAKTYWASKKLLRGVIARMF